ncbi:MAG: ATP-binding protein [Thermoanaerobaculia bacterium]
MIERQQGALTRTNDLERLIIDMESGVRGFRTTGQEPYLEPYRLAASQYEPVAAELRTLLASETDERRILAEIEEGVRQWRQAWAEPRIEYLRQHPPAFREDGIVLAPLPPELDPEVGRQGIKALRRRFEHLASLERDRVAKEVRFRDQVEARLSFVFWAVAIGCSFFLLVGSSLLFRQYRRRAGLLFAGIEAAGRGEYHPILLSGKDEPAQIAAAINRMVGDVGDRDEELRRRAEQLQEARGRLASILDSVGEGVVVADRDGKFVVFNPAAERIIGLGAIATDPADWPSTYGVFRPDTVTPFPAEELPLVRAIHGESPDDVEMFIRNPRVPDGVSISVSGRPIHDGQGAIGGGVVVFRDITERKRAEEALKQSEERVNLALESAHTGAWDLDLVHDTSVRSLRHDQIFGYPSLRPEWGSEIFLTHVLPEDRELVKGRFQEAFASGRFDMECRILWPDRSVHWIAAQGRVYRNDKQDPVRMMGVVTEVTERKLTEQFLAERSAQLEAANRELEAFSYSVSHDLRAPLRHVAGFAELLGRGAADSLDEKNRRYLQTIIDSARRMGRLIDDLLTFSRMGRAEMHLAPVNLAELVAGVRNELGPDTAGRQVVWKTNGLPVVRGDPALLRQVVVNLLSNALKYTSTRPDAEIEIGSYQQAEEIVVFVRDNGVGFDMRYADKLFGVFQRLHRAEEFEGTGIGLANVRRIIHRHGGRAWAEGEVGRGAVFYVSLPLGEKEQPS